MTNYREFYESLLQTAKDLRKEQHERINKLEADRKSGKFSLAYLNDAERNVRAYGDAIRPTLEDEAKRLRAKLEDDLQFDLNPCRMRLSEGVVAALDASRFVEYNATDWQMIMRSARSDLDKRAITDSAKKAGFVVTGYVDPAARLEAFDNFCKTLASAPETDNNGEVTHSIYNKFVMEEAQRLLDACDAAPSVAAYPVPRDFEGVAAGIIAETSTKETEEQASAEERKSFFDHNIPGDTHTSAARRDVQTTVARSKAERSLEKYKAEKARKQIEAMTEGLDNCAYEAAMKDLEARTAEATTATSTTD